MRLKDAYRGKRRGRSDYTLISCRGLIRPGRRRQNLRPHVLYTIVIIHYNYVVSIDSLKRLTLQRKAAQHKFTFGGSMIQYNDNTFWLNTKQSSYIFQVTKFGHLEHLYYGPKLSMNQPVEALKYKHTAMIGSCVNYDKSDDKYSLDTQTLEWSGIGRGDYRHSPLEMKMPDGSFVHDFVFKSYEVVDGCIEADTLPTAYNDNETSQTLSITMMDESNQVELQLIYSVFEDTDVITRRVVITNHNAEKTVLRRALSMMVDLPNRNFKMTSFSGGWIKEMHKTERLITPGMHVNSSTTGGSSNKHNPGFLVSETHATEDQGWVYEFNLIYSGNHYGVAELSNIDTVRVLLGVNSHCFEWELNCGERFEAPEAVMTFSNKGYNGASHQMHDFINAHIVRGNWKGKERPVLLNNWEAHFFDFNEGKLLNLAKRAKNLGVEMFVLDDGWFGARNDDKAGLGDYNVNRKKLPRGMKAFADRIRGMGLEFGLWFEPEMVNENSDLYRKHPEYAVTLPGKTPTLGRNQLVLNLCKPEVQDYIVDSVTKILDEANVTYVKWDMNRHMSEVFSETLANQGEFYHRYIIGLYSVLDRIFTPRPHILLESCSSGGNRFDLGMLCYSPQIWSSDDTDPIERLEIQSGLSYLYPPSTMGAHVSSAPHQQTLRDTPLSTRFNVAAFGCLGYELDLKYLSKVENEEVKAQIAFYKAHRKTLQFGTFSRIETQKSNKVQWQSIEGDGSKAITGFYQTLSTASEGYDLLKIKGLSSTGTYQVTTKPQSIYVERFGELVKHILPVALHPDGLILRTANKFYCLNDCVESYEAKGDLLESGILLNNQYMGTGHNDQIRLLGDYGSNLYVAVKVE